jgi:predicted metal-dependent HD superfamily phosphohydrolase
MSEKNGTALQNSWEQLLQGFSVEQARTQAIFTSLIDLYRSPGRVYHTLDHIQNVLQWVEILRDYANDLPVIQLAAWFHDSIYDPRATDNEERSAAYAQSSLSNSGIAAETLQTVSQMILSTKTHRAEESTIDCQILLDADLAILGASVPLYDIYAQAIRQEYSWVPEVSYKNGRVQILQMFLQRTRIYCTKPLYAALEEQARANIRREIASLSQE